VPKAEARRRPKRPETCIAEEEIDASGDNLFQQFRCS
jgi:hypothetical protein